VPARVPGEPFGSPRDILAWKKKSLSSSLPLFFVWGRRMVLREDGEDFLDALAVGPLACPAGRESRRKNGWTFTQGRR
jgi:hypothetical protein